LSESCYYDHLGNLIADLNFRFMFDFLLQRFGKKQPDSISLSEEKRNARQAAANETRQAAIQEAHALPEDENEALAFILRSSSADARFIAAQKIHSKAALEQVRSAMRNTDRRVTRLMQSELDALSQREQHQEQVQACIELALRLKNETHLLPGQVADLDHQWSAVKKTDTDDGASLFQQYETVRSEIGLRLVNQAALQREVMDALSALKRLEEDNTIMPPERDAQLAVLLASSENRLQSREWGSLPRHLVAEFDEAKTRLLEQAQLHAKKYAALALRIDVLEEWENADISSLKRDDLLKKWQSLPAGNDLPGSMELDARFDALAAHLAERERPALEQKLEQRLSSSETASLFAQTLSLMKKAIEEGAVREATQQNEQIARLDFSTFEAEPEHKALLVALRAELKNLTDWARWSGKASREALLRMVEALPDKNYPLEELAAAVVDARGKWKALNETSGMADKNQWLQFDAACNRAYEPVMEYARAQAAAREQNREKAQALIDSTGEILSGLNLSSEKGDINWRELIEYQRQAQHAWLQIGPVMRKERKKLDAEFGQLMKPLNALLREEANNEIQRRQALIENIRALDPQDRKSARIARGLQEKWQESARIFPLDSREDRKLWQQFRNASEIIFAHRDKLNKEAEKARLHALHEKEKLCEKLETDQAETLETIQRVLKEADTKWRAAGPVSKEHDPAIQKRYDAAVNVLQSRVQTIRSEEKNRQVAVLVEKLTLCQKAEKAILDQPELADELKALWAAQPVGVWKKILGPRFDAALNALKEKDAAYAEVLKSRQPLLLDQLLRLEITASMDSPSDFSEKRRQIQLEVLKESLSGNRHVSPHEQLESLCALPVLTDAVSADRIIRLIEKTEGIRN